VIPILVDEARMPSADELPATLAPLVRRNAVETEQWDDAGNLLGQVLRHRPDYAEAARKLELARRQQALASHYAQASAAADAGRARAIVQIVRNAVDPPGPPDRDVLRTLAPKSHRLVRAASRGIPGAGTG
jgi:hypothetical protein